MKNRFTFLLLIISATLSAQEVYTIKADSTKLTGCDSNELIIENHTQDVLGFLYNKGRGRTIFKRPLTKISDTFYLVGADTLKLRNPNAWVQGGNSFGTTGVIGTKDKKNFEIITNSVLRARFDTLNNFIFGDIVAQEPYHFNVGTPARFSFSPSSSNCVDIGTLADNYNIRLAPYVPNLYGTGVGASAIFFGSVYTSIGVCKAAIGNIATNTLIIGAGVGSGTRTAIVDGASNPTVHMDVNGVLTLNGGYSGIRGGGAEGAVNNSSAWAFPINGVRGTGTGTAGDIVFSTGNSQASGMTIHTMTNRWWLKGGTGYLSNTSTPTSSVDVTGANGYSQLRMRTTYTPSSTADTNGNTGDFSWDSNYIYVKTASGWKRSALTTF